MKPKKDTHKVGIRTKPRGQQMGTAGAADQNRKEMKETPRCWVVPYRENSTK